MANDVFANGLEIACKAADGKSVACFPDPCFTPPSPPAGWILVPYANTAYAKDTTKGTKTVFITGKPVMKKDVSYFKISTGNEPAAGPKGVVTGVKKGKAYFTSWSMNVKVEGKNVDRHTDGITHNHGSKPGNTSVWVYSDTGHAPPECLEQCKKIEKNCGKGTTATQAKNICDGTNKRKEKEKEKEKDSYAKDRRKMKERLLKQFDKFAEKNGFTFKKEKTWKSKECLEFLVKPGGVDEQIKAIDEQIAKIEKTIKEAPSKLSNMSQLADWKFIAKEIGSAIIPNSLDDLLPQKRVRQIKLVLNYPEQKKMVENAMRSASKTITDIWKNTQDFLQELKTQKALLGYAKNSTPEEIAALQEKAAKAKRNKCVKARKCLLEPYNKSTIPKTLFSKEGCCPGQTAHHLIPDSYFRDSDTNTNIPDCKGSSPSKRYTHGSAPTVCTEGGNASGSHGKMHTKTDANATKKIDNGKLKYEDAKDAAISAHADTFGGMCGEGNKCLIAQLDNYFKRRCSKENFRVKPKKTTPGGGWLEGASKYPAGTQR